MGNVIQDFDTTHPDLLPTESDRFQSAAETTLEKSNAKRDHLLSSYLEDTSVDCKPISLTQNLPSTHGS